MKKIFILALSLMLMSVMALGQSLEPFFSSKPGRVLVYENLDADGNLISVNADSLSPPSSIRETAAVSALKS